VDAVLLVDDNDTHLKGCQLLRNLGHEEFQQRVRARLVKIYTDHKSRRVHEVDKLLADWSGREAELLANTETEYRKKYLSSTAGQAGSRPRNTPDRAVVPRTPEKLSSMNMSGTPERTHSCMEVGPEIKTNHQMASAQPAAVTVSDCVDNDEESDLRGAQRPILAGRVLECISCALDELKPRIGSPGLGTRTAHDGFPLGVSVVKSVKDELFELLESENRALGKADQPMHHGSTLFVVKYGQGVYIGFQRNFTGSNYHILQFPPPFNEQKLKLSEEEWGCGAKQIAEMEEQQGLAIADASSRRDTGREMAKERLFQQAIDQFDIALKVAKRTQHRELENEIEGYRERCRKFLDLAQEDKKLREKF